MLNLFHTTTLFLVAAAKLKGKNESKRREYTKSPDHFTVGNGREISRKSPLQKAFAKGRKWSEEISLLHRHLPRFLSWV